MEQLTTSVPEDLDDSPIKLFVGQLPRVSEEEDLRTFFQCYGDLVECVIIRDKHNGRHRGCAFLTYEKKESALLAIEEMNEKVAFPGSASNLQIRPANNVEKEYKLFIGMLPKSVDDSMLSHRFSIYGDVKEVTSLAYSLFWLLYSDLRFGLIVRSMSSVVMMDSQRGVHLLSIARSSLRWKPSKT